MPKQVGLLVQDCDSAQYVGLSTGQLLAARILGDSRGSVISTAMLSSIPQAF